MKKNIYIVLSMMLSFYTDAMIRPNSSLQIAHIENDYQSIKNNSEIPEIKKLKVPSEEQDIASPQLYILKEIFGAYYDSDLDRTVIDISYPALKAHFQRFYSEKKSMKNSDEDKYIFNLILAKILKVTSYTELIDLTLEHIFDTSKLSEHHSNIFLEILGESKNTSTGTQRIQSLLLTKLLGDISSSAFNKWRTKISIESSDHSEIDITKETIYLNFNHLKENETFFSIPVTPLSKTITPTQKLYQSFLHEISHCYHSKLFNIPTNICTICTLNDPKLKKLIFPSHDKEIFDAIASKFAAKLKKAKLEAHEYIELYKYKLMSQKELDAFHLPTADLLSNYNKISDKYEKMAQIIMAKIVSPNSGIDISSIDADNRIFFRPENYWNSAEEILTIFGIIPIDIFEHKFAIIDRQNENIENIRQSNIYRIFHVSPTIFDEMDIYNVVMHLVNRTTLKDRQLLLSIIEEDPTVGTMKTPLNEAISIYLSNLLKAEIRRIAKPYKSMTEMTKTDDQVYDSIDYTTNNAATLALEKFGTTSLSKAIETTIIFPTLANFIIDHQKLEFDDLPKYSSGITLLHVAIEYRMDHFHIKRIIDIIPEEKRSEYINSAAYYKEGVTALHLAYSIGQIETVDLLEQHVDVKKTNLVGSNLLHFAASGTTDERYISKKLSLIDRILSQYERYGIGIDSADNELFTALHWAVKANNPKIVDYLLKNGATPDTLDKKGLTPIEKACADDKIEIVKLLAAKVNINKVYRNNETILHIACKYGSEDLINYLLSFSNLNLNIENKDYINLFVMLDKRNDISNSVLRNFIAKDPSILETDSFKRTNFGLILIRDTFQKAPDSSRSRVREERL